MRKRARVFVGYGQSLFEHFQFRGFFIFLLIPDPTPLPLSKPVVYDANNPPAQLPFEEGKKKIVILGSGWAATSLLKSIDTEQYSVTVISPYNYFLFTPLLPSVTVGTLNGRSIAQPTR